MEHIEEDGICMIEAHSIVKNNWLTRSTGLNTLLQIT